jgi:tetratricopeptide (TPR) repeat protein
MRAWLSLLVCFMIWSGESVVAQSAADVDKPLDAAYDALRTKDYEAAIISFLEALRLAPERAGIRKDLAYTYLKTGETEAARDQFGEAMRLNPNDFQAALEYGFLCHETRQTAKARRVFDRVRQSDDSKAREIAETAFQNIDRPLQEGIARWSKVVAERPADFMAHYELARLSDSRDELETAADHYRQAWKIDPGKSEILIDLAKVYRSLNRTDEANASLLVASRGREARASEAARELFPDRYPYVYEFRNALALDPDNATLRRELAYLLLAMNRKVDAEKEFQRVLQKSPDDLLAAAQLGFLMLERNAKSEAMSHLERVMAGSDLALANRVRAVLRVPLKQNAETAQMADSRTLAEKSLQSGYLNDALRYLKAANEEDPKDPWVKLKLGWTYNVLRQDREAIYWFDQARQSEDPAISAEAAKSYQNLKPEYARFRTTVWTYPVYSSRWRDVFTYGQVKTELRIGNLPLRPYLSLRLLGDLRATTGGPMPLYLSENALVPAAGLATRPWKGLTFWGEAGIAWSYRGKQPNFGRAIPDYRGGLSYAKGFGRSIGSEVSGAFAETTVDALYVHRFDRDVLAYWQNRFGWTVSRGVLRVQAYAAANATRDLRRQAWANFLEGGPGIRWRFPGLPPNVVLFGEYLRGTYTLKQYGQRPARYVDIRGGLWYAFSY